MRDDTRNFRLQTGRHYYRGANHACAVRFGPPTATDVALPICRPSLACNGLGKSCISHRSVPRAPAHPQPDHHALAPFLYLPPPRRLFTASPQPAANSASPPAKKGRQPRGPESRSCFVSVCMGATVLGKRQQGSQHSRDGCGPGHFSRPVLFMSQLGRN